MHTMGCIGKYEDRFPIVRTCLGWRTTPNKIQTTRSPPCSKANLLELGCDVAKACVASFLKLAW